jgi:Na+/H+-dicarboxylate symporter
MKLHVAIAVGLVAGLAYGLVAAATGTPALLSFASALEPVGAAFVNLLRMVVMPLVVATLFVGVAGMGDPRQLGRLGALSLLFFAVTTAIAVLIGMGVMALLLPLADPGAARALTGAAPAEAPPMPSVLDFLLSLIPSNPFQAAAEGALLPLIVFTALFGAAVSTLEEEQRNRMVALADAASTALIRLVNWVLWVAPVGVFALAAPVAARSGWAVLQSLAVFLLAVLAGLVLFIGLVYLPAVRFIARRSPGEFLKACLGPQMIGFTTTSSAASIPAMLEAADTHLRLSRTVASFVIPLAASLNRAGSALFQGAAVVFLAWLYGMPLAPAAVGGAALATFMVSFTVAAVPSASLLTMAPALNQVGVPLEGLGVLFGVDRIPDMFRTATNVTGHLAAAVVVERAAGGEEGARPGERRTTSPGRKLKTGG